INKMPKHDIFTGILVALITIFLHNLALAVLIGVIISALVFAWESAKRIRARKFIDADGIKYYEIYGPLFFGSVTAFNDKFEIASDPEKVVVDFKESRISDMSGIEALNTLTRKYREAGKELTLKHLSPDCRKLLQNAEGVIEVNIQEDPAYNIAVDQI
ncbi:MAG: STAS domain-containing protein, partial [Bacteroidota bacterium]